MMEPRVLSRTQARVAYIAKNLQDLYKSIGVLEVLVAYYFSFRRKVGVLYVLVGVLVQRLRKTLHRRLFLVATRLATRFPFRGKLRIEIGEELQDMGIDLQDSQQETLDVLQESSKKGYMRLLGELRYKALVGKRVVDLRYLPGKIEVLEL